MRRTTSSRHHAAATRCLRGACGRPRAAAGSAECCIGAALLGTIWRGCRVALRTSTTTQIDDRIGTRARIAPSSERTLRQRQFQQHEERGRTFERPTSATPGTGRRHAKFKFHWARIVRRMRARSRCSERRIRALLARLPSLPNRRIPAALSCPSKNLLRSSLPSVADLGHAPVMSSASIVGSGPKLGPLR